MKLILNGGGSGKKCHKSYKKFKQLVGEKKVLFIPFANDEMSYDQALEWFKEELKPYGIKDIVMIKNVKDLTLDLLKSVGGVYLSGGNAFLLLSILKSCDVFKILKEYLYSDCVFMASSAGVTVCGKNINSCLRDDLKIAASDKNNIGLKNTEGFNIVEGYSFLVHYKLIEEQYSQTELKVQRLLKENYKLICLPEETSLYIEDGKITIMGDKPCEVITNLERKNIRQNEKFTHEDNCV